MLGRGTFRESAPSVGSVREPLSRSIRAAHLEVPAARSRPGRFSGADPWNAQGGAVQEPAARRKSRPSGGRRGLPRHPQPRLSACVIVGRADAGCRRDQEKSTQTTPLERSVLSPQIYWVPAPEGARLAVMPCPRGHEWLLEELSAWRRDGMDSVISLLEDREVRDLGLTQEARLCRSLGLSFLSFPVPDRGVPPSVREVALPVAGVRADTRAG